LILGGILIVAAGVAGAVAVGPAVGGGAAIAALLLVLVVVFVLADRAAEDDFFRAYAAGRGLAWSDSRTQLPPLTELLRKGDRRYAEMTLNGKLPSGPNGTLAHFTYEEDSTDSEGNRQTSYYHFTVVVCQLPDAATFVDQLACHRRSGFRFMDSTEDVFRKRQRLDLESESFDKRYEVFLGQNDDMNRARQIFEPSFIVWLAENAPKSFEFELVSGALVCDVKGKLESAKDLDGICGAAGVVASRLAAESTE
jgi:hypothetical protein